MSEETIEEKIERWKKGVVTDAEVAEIISAILLASHRRAEAKLMLSEG